VGTCDRSSGLRHQVRHLVVHTRAEMLDRTVRHALNCCGFPRGPPGMAIDRIIHDRSQV
jgi:hypothetical protein